ncbi:hypothetical protein [Minwuia sp.]|uniref:hypothetical protein n=1 Tax=Minwuia sp. TaxID=2493630 RepID=UPI003A8EAC14
MLYSEVAQQGRRFPVNLPFGGRRLPVHRHVAMGMLGRLQTFDQIVPAQDADIQQLQEQGLDQRQRRIAFDVT